MSANKKKKNTTKKKSNVAKVDEVKNINKTNEKDNNNKSKNNLKTSNTDSKQKSTENNVNNKNATKPKASNNTSNKTKDKPVNSVSNKAKTDTTKNTVNKEKKPVVKDKKKDTNKKDETKEEQVVFKEKKNKSVEKSEKIKKEKKPEEKSDKKVADNKDSKKKIIFIVINIIIILLIILIFSTMFAIIHKTKPTIARGVSIKNIDISNLTYDEAKTKLEEAFDVSLDVNIKLSYKDYSYVLKSSEISLAYDIGNSLNEAYNIGRNGNIIQNNYELIATALLKKDIQFDFSYNDEELNKVVEEISNSVPGLVKQYSYDINENELVIKPGKDGIKVNKEKLKQQILEEITNRNPQEIIKDYKNSIIEISKEDVKADSIDIEAIYKKIHSEPKDAYYKEATATTKFEIHPDEDGIDFAISMDEAKKIISEKKDEYIIPLNRKKAAITIKDIGIEAFPYKISTFSTTYDASNTGRSENLRISASKINGTVIMPGEQFSFNGVVGERTVTEGYQDAKIYSDGQVVDGLAGGICQISSTLYNAALLANLQIDERSNHSFTTSYVAPGRDATVVYGIKDLKFTNTREYPIKIEASVANGIAEFTLYGIQEEKEYEVRIIPVTTATIPFTVQTITDPSLQPGQMLVSQAGASGSKVTTYKEVYLNGAQISRDILSNDVYKVMTRIVRVGPEAAPAPAPAPGQPPQ